jgi:hypothetical protein
MRRTLVYQPHNPCTPSLLEDNTQENAKNAANAKKTHTVWFQEQLRHKESIILYATTCIK